MTPQRWKQVDHLFHQAAALPAAERASWLDQACGGDAELHAEVAALLASDSAAEGFVQQEIRGAIASFHSGASQESRRIGPYRLVRELGRGGMGTVYLAERADDQYQGEVAIKLVRPGMDTDFFLARFRRERQTLARLQHPHIARLLDSGTTPDGLPFIVMERIDGPSVTVYCAQHKLGVEAILRLFLPICAAVAYAHRSFVVHRDLKPGNILVDAAGAPKLLDFGICKLLLGEVSGDGTLTGGHMMTPDYASPEQVRGDAITIASDVYSLGAVLFELLAGARPHRIARYTPREVERAICEENVAPPSGAASDRAVARLLAGDLDNIVLKSMQKEPGRRYASVDQFAEDIHRYLAHLPVLARPDTLRYRAGKFVRRNRGALAAAAVLTVVVIAGLSVSLQQASIARGNFLQARKLASGLIFDVHDRVRDLPGSLPAREAILRLGLTYLDNIAGAARNDSSLRIELATAYERMGNIQGNNTGSSIGDTKGAMVSFQKGLAVLRPQDSSQAAQLERMALLRRIGNLLHYHGQIVESSARFNEAIAIGAALYSKSPHDDEVRAALANIYDDFASAQSRGSMNGPGIENESKALLLFQELLAAHPADPSARASVATALSGLGALQHRNNQLQPANANFQSAAAVWDDLCGADPANTSYQRSRMLAYSHIGDVLGNPAYPNLGNPGGAVSAYRVMLAIAEQLYRGNPGDPGAAIDYGMALSRAAGVPAQTGEERIGMFRQSVSVLTAAADRQPDNKILRLNLASIHEQLGQLLAAANRRDEARSEYRAAFDLAQANLGALAANYRILITTGLQLGLDAVRRGDGATAIDYGKRAVHAAETTPPGPEFQTLPPRAYAALGDIYQALQKPADAREWWRRSLAGLQQLRDVPGFTAAQRDLMQHLEKELNRK